MKRYEISQSPLFRASSPADLARRLGLSPQELEDIANRADNYKHFQIGKAKKRAVQEPKDRVRELHRKITRWLMRIETPDYLHSAIRGRSYISNASAHRADVNLVKVDIRSFFQNVTRHAVYLFLVDQMKMRGDAAMLLAKLLTVDGHLPTGSSVSPILSYFAHKRMFDEIAELTGSRDLTFTVYVDDMSISGDGASRRLLFEVRKIIAHAGLKSHKCRFFPAGVPRVVTGVALTGSGRRLPNARHLRIHQAFEELENTPDGPLHDRKANALKSRLFEASQIEPIWLDRARSFSRDQEF